jgi:hypothetical protein
MRDLRLDDGGRVAGWPLGFLLKILFYYLFRVDFLNPHCWQAIVVSLLAGGHPPAKIVISPGTRLLLAGVAPTSTKAF